MKYQKYIIPVFILVAIVQLAVPLQMIWHKEKVLQNGQIVKFQTAPVDPTDPFRGKYISLRYDNSLTRFADEKHKWQVNEPVKVFIRLDNQGFAHIDSLSKKSAGTPALYINARIDFVDEGNNIVGIDYPFNRFYMEEHKAPEAEKIYNQNRRGSLHKAFAVLKVLKGDAAIIDVVIDKKPIQQAVEQQLDSINTTLQRPGLKNR